MDKKYLEEEITALSARDAIRYRPMLHFASCFEEQTLDAFPLEALCPALDEHIEGNCSHITITLHEDAFTVQYNSGISLQKNTEGLTNLERILTQIYTCSNLKKHLSVGEEFCKMGMAAINFVSTKMECTTVWEEQKGVFILEEGLLISKEITPAKGIASWTSLYIKPDPSIFGDLPITLAGVQKRVAALRVQYPTLEVVVEQK